MKCVKQLFALSFVFGCLTIQADWSFDWSRVLKGEPPIIQLVEPVIQRGSKIVADSVNLEHLVNPLVDAVRTTITAVQGGIKDFGEIIQKAKNVHLAAPTMTNIKSFAADLNTELGYVHDFIQLMLALVEEFARTGLAAGDVTKALGDLAGDFGVDTKGIPQAIQADTVSLEHETKGLPKHLEEVTQFIHTLESKIVAHVQAAFIS